MMSARSSSRYSRSEIVARCEAPVMPDRYDALPLQDFQMNFELITVRLIFVAVRQENSAHMQSPELDQPLFYIQGT